MSIRLSLIGGLVLVFSTAVHAASLITSTDVTLLDQTTILDQDNTFLNQFPDITQPVVNQSSMLPGNGSSSVQVDLAAGSFKVFADSTFASTGTQVISSSATINYDDRLILSSDIDQLVNIEMVFNLTGNVSGAASAISMAYTMGGDIRHTLFTDSTHAQPFTFTDTIAFNNILVPAVGVAFVDFSISLTAQASDIGFADSSNSLGYSFIIPGNITAQLDSGIPVSSVPIPTAAWLFSTGLIGLIGVARRKTA